MKLRWFAGLGLALLLAAGEARAVPGGLQDCSGTITTGGASQSLIGSATARYYLMVANPAQAGGANLGISLAAGAGGQSGAAAIGSAGTLTLYPGQSFTFDASTIPTNGLNIVGPNTSQAFTCWFG